MVIHGISILLVRRDQYPEDRMDQLNAAIRPGGILWQ